MRWTSPYFMDEVSIISQEQRRVHQGRAADGASGV
jgi:hypothetical protein